MRTTHVSHGPSGFTLVIEDTPFWALAVDRSVEQLLSWLGHPCCGNGLGRIEWVNVLAWRFLTWGSNVAWRRTTTKLQLSITTHQALEDLDAFPGWVEDGTLILDGESEYGDIWADGVVIAQRCDDCQTVVPGEPGEQHAALAAHQLRECPALRYQE